MIFEGTLHKRMTVGYRSPYFLETEDGKQVEVRATGKRRDLLDPLIHKKVKIRGKRIVTPPRKAEAGSEAESRFLDGQIPGLEYMEIQEINEIKSAQAKSRRSRVGPR